MTIRTAAGAVLTTPGARVAVWRDRWHGGRTVRTQVSQLPPMIFGPRSAYCRSLYSISSRAPEYIQDFVASFTGPERRLALRLA